MCVCTLVLLAFGDRAPAQALDVDSAVSADEIIRRLSAGELDEEALRSLLRQYRQIPAEDISAEQRAEAEKALGSLAANMLRSMRAPLVIAARDGDIEAVRAELGRGVDPDAKMGNETALMNASLQGYEEIARLLLHAGADPTLGIHEDASWTALRFAAMNGRLGVLELLLAHEPGPPAAVLRDAVFVAAEMGRPETLTRLAEAGADVSEADAEGTTCLMRAARGGHPQTIGALARLGAPLDARDAKRRTALMLAAWLGHAATVEALVAAGADPHLRDADGNRAFPAGTSGDAFASIAAQSHFRATAQPDACPTLIGYTGLHEPEGGPVAANAYGLYRRPTIGSAAWVAAYADGGVVPAKIRAVEPSEYPENAWDAQLDLPPAKASALLGERDSAAALLLWPASGEPTTHVRPPAVDLPYGVFPESIRLALDTDGDERADILELAYCCKQPFQTQACEYICGSTWQKTGPTWAQCERTQPE